MRTAPSLAWLSYLSFCSLVWHLIWLIAAPCGVHSAAVVRLLSLVQLCLLSCQHLLLLSQNLGVVLILHRCCSLGSRSTLALRMVTLADCDVLGALPIADPHLLPLVLKVELLRLRSVALGRLWMVVQL